MRLEKAEADLKALNKNGRPTKTALRKANSLIERIRSLLDGVESTDFALVQKPFLWPIAFPEVLREGDPNAGFDIVLANPPYVRQERLDAEDQRSYEEAFPEVHTGTADILVYFYARALQILRPSQMQRLGGWLSFITSNKFMRASYGAGIREHLPASLRIRRVIDFGDLPLFEANRKAIAAYPSVLVGSRSDETDGHALTVADLTGPVRKELSNANLKVNSESVRGVLEDLDGLLANSEIADFPPVMLKRDGWVLEDPTQIRLFERLMDKGTPLGEFVEGRIYRGVVTGLNDAFVIDQDKRDELVEEDPRCAGILKPWLRGRDIKRWRAESAGRYVIAIQNSGDAGANNLWAQAKSEEEARDILRETYPAIHDHLSWFEQKLRIRQDQGRYWWELRACAYYQEFAHPKIVWPDIAPETRFAWDPTGNYLGNTAYAMPTTARWLLTVLNSGLVNFLLNRISNSLRGGYLRLIHQYVSQVRIVTPDKDTEAELETLAQEMLSLGGSPEQVEAIEREIDAIVFHVYGLSASERKLVLDWLGERREAFGTEMPPDWRKLNSLQASAGAWKGNVDGDGLIRDIRASRDIHTRPVPRL